ncbi:MAG: hypothetical protein H7061_07880 [Bdellovibrionaceae bacterium]|nr:hypothetical protein [Bdellovibrio sp.]
MANNDKKDSKDHSRLSDATSAISDTLKKIISSGSPTEISKEIINTVISQALKAKDDVAVKVSSEMIALVKKIDFVKEFAKFAENHKFKITAEIEVSKKNKDEKD